MMTERGVTRCMEQCVWREQRRAERGGVGGTWVVCVIIYSFVYVFVCFFFNDTATTEIYTLSLHDALPI